MDPDASMVEPGGEATVEQAGAPDTQPEAGQPESPDQQPEQQSIELTPELIEKLLQEPQYQQRLLEAEPVKRVIQSQKDREIAREKRRLLEEQRRQAEEARRRAEEEELERLLAQGDYEEYGKRKAVYDRQQRQYLEAAQQVSAMLEQALAESAYDVLGEETVTSLYQEVAAKNGTVIDFAKALEQAKADKLAASRLEEKKQEIMKELQAQLVEAGALKRAEQAQVGAGPSPGVSGAAGAPRQMTLEEAREAYIDGRISSAEYAKYDPNVLH